jgi:hypothetical protein
MFSTSDRSEQVYEQETHQGSDMLLIRADFRISLQVVDRAKAFLTPTPSDVDEQRIQEVVHANISKDEMGAGTANTLPRGHHTASQHSVVEQCAP